MPLPAATVSALNSFSSTATAQFSLPPKRNVSLSSSYILSRRDIALLSFFSLSAPASAIDIGICKHTLLQFITSCYCILNLNHNPNFCNHFSAGPKDWLREQKKKSSKFLLAPVDASRESLRSVYLYLSTNFSFLSSSQFSLHIVSYLIRVCLFRFFFTAEFGATYTDEDLQKFQQLFRSAARDCVPEDRNSFVAFQANTGVEVCLCHHLLLSLII